MPETKPSDEAVDKLIEATGLKLSAADVKTLRAGKQVALDNYTLRDLGSVFVKADTVGTAAKESRKIKDLLTGGGTSGGAVPRIKVKCVKIGRLTCCLEAGWPPYVQVNCSGTF